VIRGGEEYDDPQARRPRGADRGQRRRSGIAAASWLNPRSCSTQVLPARAGCCMSSPGPQAAADAATCVSRNARISPAISWLCVAVAKWPVSRRCNSASGRSSRYARAPAGGKKASFRPHGSSAGGVLVRRYSCQPGYSSTLRGLTEAGVVGCDHVTAVLEPFDELLVLRRGAREPVQQQRRAGRVSGLPVEELSPANVDRAIRGHALISTAATTVLTGERR
jgi:hypothetical protein